MVTFLFGNNNGFYKLGSRKICLRPYRKQNLRARTVRKPFASYKLEQQDHFINAGFNTATISTKPPRYTTEQNLPFKLLEPPGAAYILKLILVIV